MAWFAGARAVDPRALMLVTFVDERLAPGVVERYARSPDVDVVVSALKDGSRLDEVQWVVRAHLHFTVPSLLELGLTLGEKVVETTELLDDIDGLLPSRWVKSANPAAGI